MDSRRKSPITGHSCFLGPRCDLWHRKNNVSITCGSYGSAFFLQDTDTSGDTREVIEAIGETDEL